MKIKQLNISNIFLRNGVYYYSKMINGVRHKFSLQTRDLSEALKVAEECNKQFRLEKVKQYSIKMGLHPSSQEQKIEKRKVIKISAKPTLIQAFNNYIRVCEQEHQTKDRIKGKERIKQILINKKWIWDELTHENILDFQEKAQKEHKPHTAYKKIGYLKGFVNYCTEVGYFDYNDYKRIKWMKRPPRTEVKVKIINEDLRKIIDYLVENHDINFLNFVMTQLVTVSRMVEVLNLKVEHLDFDNEEIRIFQNKVKEPKISQVPLHILNSLKRLAEINDNKNGYIFYQPKNKGFYANEFTKIKKALNLREEYILPKLRHTAISYVAEGSGLIVAQQMAGHKSHKTTADHYCIADTRHSRKASESIVNTLLQR